MKFITGKDRNQTEFTALYDKGYHIGTEFDYAQRHGVEVIVEHPFGVIKRQWDFYYIMTKKSIKHASADVGLIFTAYNLRRILNLIDQNQLKEFLKGLALTILGSLRLFKSIKPTFLCADYSPRYLRTQINVAYIAYI